MALKPKEMCDIPTIPDQIIHRLKTGREPTDEQELEAAKAIRLAGLEIRRRNGVSTEDLQSRQS